LENPVKSLLTCGFAHAFPDAFFFAGFLGLLVYAAVSDARAFRIPNAVSLALTGLFFVRLFFVAPQAGLLAHLLTAGAAFVILFGLYLMGGFGAGDTKLITAILLWAGPVAGLQFAVVLALAGGLFAGLLLGLGKLLKAFPELAAYVPSRRLCRWARHGICPYGLPIFAAAVLVVPQVFAGSPCGQI
jgi:prepilin peptidase CpaA